jgi:hypothetical protein
MAAGSGACRRRNRRGVLRALGETSSFAAAKLLYRAAYLLLPLRRKTAGRACLPLVATRAAAAGRDVNMAHP